MIFLTFLHSAGFSHNDLKKLFEHEQNYAEILKALDAGKRIDTPWMTEERYQKIIQNLHKIDRKKIETSLHEKQIQIITIHDPLYPEKLKTIKQSPYLLYVRGDLRDSSLTLGVVGSRRNTTYGKKVLDHLLPPLIDRGAAIVSGGAYGIDALAHEVTLEYGGYTISVFGCGVDVVYPVQNTRLFTSILDSGGALVSSFPVGTKAEPYMFPVRNEIVAALSDGIIIPEAGIKSGTLITAGLALEHGRDVFAVPGDIFHETSLGTNQLIAKGEAKCTQSAQDILEEYFPDTSLTAMSLFEKKTWNSEEESDIYKAVSEGYSTPDMIGQQTPYTIDTIIMTLSMLEMDGHIRLSAGGKYEIV